MKKGREPAILYGVRNVNYRSNLIYMFKVQKGQTIMQYLSMNDARSDKSEPYAICAGMIGWLTLILVSHR
jgi:hypothetical protein